MVINHKRGDTLNWECEYVDDAGVAVNLTTYVIKCQARDKAGVLLFNLSVADGIVIYAPTEGKFRITINDTSKFDITMYDIDIQYTIGAMIKSSDIFQLNVTRDITR